MWFPLLVAYILPRDVIMTPFRLAHKQCASTIAVLIAVSNNWYALYTVLSSTSTSKVDDEGLTMCSRV